MRQKIKIGSFLLVILLSMSCANAQDKTANTESAQPAFDFPSNVNVTPEMWMYMHEYQRQQDPKAAIRKKAEFRAQQRRNRIEAQKWFGYSKLRPTASAVPYFTNSYGTRWTGLPWSPYQWSGYSSVYQVQQNPSAVERYPVIRVAENR